MEKTGFTSNQNKADTVQEIQTHKASFTRNSCTEAGKFRQNLQARNKKGKRAGTSKDNVYYNFSSSSTE
jgi:hypothetical protein